MALRPPLGKATGQLVGLLTRLYCGSLLMGVAMANAAAPKLECDLVMSGGITSGLVYPRAVAWLAETYRFRSIGGTSAGAVAAAATAAGALGVRNGNDQFQTRIKGLPSELATEVSGKTVLERLFQPQKSMRRLFRVLMAGLGREHWTAKGARLIAALCTGYWVFVLAGVAIALGPLLVLAYAYEVAGVAFWLLLATGLVLAVVLAALAAAYGVVRDIFRRLPQNRYGMCSLSSNGKPDEAGILPLTDWLHELFQSVAGRKIHDLPVTFGDLWGNDGQEESERDIELVLMTTNVTRGVSHRFPFVEGSWGQLFAKESDFAELFPESVVLWMKRHAQERRHTDVTVPPGYFGLPKPADLPILLGARMSLSFPFLVSAVPLYAADPINRSPDGKIPLERCWFSDGGLTSNFPLHFFDAPLPSRPTFGINLVPATVYMAETAEDEQTVSSSLKPDSAATAGANPWSHIYMPSRNASGIGSAARFNKFEGKKGSVAGFFGALFDTARNWGDTELMAMPGYRDRIVHVLLDPDEGGLNLNMPEDVITRIGERGERAGELLAARFAPEPGLDPQTQEDIVLTWDNHRWIRYRSLMAGLELVARRFRATWTDAASQKPWRSYDELLRRGKTEKPTSYPYARPGQYKFAASVTAQFVDFVANWTTPDQTFDRGEKSSAGRSPRPKPVLRMMPPGSNDPRAERAPIATSPPDAG